jgi:hypothetical protein
VASQINSVSLELFTMANYSKREFVVSKERL